MKNSDKMVFFSYYTFFPAECQTIFENAIDYFLFLC